MSFSFKLKLFRNDVAVGSLPTVSESSILSPPSFSRKTLEECTNDVKVQYTQLVGFDIPVAASVAYGWDNACVVMSDGTAWIWDGSGDPVTDFVQAMSGTITQAIMCNNHGHRLSILESTGQYWYYGDNYQGQSGTGTSGSGTSTYDPENLIQGVKSFIYTAMGGWIHHGIDSSGKLWSAGRDTWGTGAIGIEDQDENYADWEEAATPPTVFISVDNGQLNGAGIDNQGKLWTWGYNAVGELGAGVEPDSDAMTCPEEYCWYPYQVGTDTNWIRVEVGELTMVAMKSDGSLWGWGYNYEGSLAHTPGDLASCKNVSGDFCEHWEPVDISFGKTFLGFSHGWYHTVGIDLSGNVWTCGMDDGGALGLGYTPSGDHVFEWTQVPNIQASQVAAGYSTTIIINTEGRVLMCGDHETNVPTLVNFGDYWS